MGGFGGLIREVGSGLGAARKGLQTVRKKKRQLITGETSTPSSGGQFTMGPQPQQQQQPRKKKKISGQLPPYGIGTDMSQSPNQ